MEYKTRYILCDESSVAFEVCECGSVVADMEAHDKFHEALTATSSLAGLLSPIGGKDLFRVDI